VFGLFALNCIRDLVFIVLHVLTELGAHSWSTSVVVIVRPCVSTYTTRVPRYSLHLLSPGCFQTLERKKRSLLGQKMPFVKGKGRGWSDDAFSSEDGMSTLSTA